MKLPLLSLLLVDASKPDPCGERKLEKLGEETGRKRSSSRLLYLLRAMVKVLQFSNVHLVDQSKSATERGRVGEG
jgi:hypothetical protein